MGKGGKGGHQDELENIGEAALQVPEKQSANDKHARRISKHHRELLPMRPRGRQQAIAIRSNNPAQRIQLDEQLKLVRNAIFGDHDRRNPEPEHHHHRQHLHRIAQINLKARHDPADADPEEPEKHHINR